MHTDYRIPSIRNFRDIQLRNGSAAQLVELADKAEQLIGQVVRDRTYRAASLLSRIDPATELDADSRTSGRDTGDDIAQDLCSLVEDFTGAAGLSAESARECVLTAEQLSGLFGVSTKTISRWRQHGLVGRKFRFDGRQRIGFLKSSVDRFAEDNQDRIERGSRFRQLTDSERTNIVEQAAQLSKAGKGLNVITHRLATTLGRSRGTIRGAIRQFDRAHPDKAIFPHVTNPMSDDIRSKIYRQYRSGDAIDTLAKRYGRTKTTIHRIVNRLRYQRVEELPLDFIPNHQFPRIRNDAAIVGPMPASDGPQRKVRVPKGLPNYLASLYDVALLSREQEQHVFRKMNYLIYRADRLRRQLDATRPQSRLLDEIERLYDEAVLAKNQIIRANLRLVVSIAKRHIDPNEDLFTLISDGNISLIRAVEKFDFSRGFKFSTYASWAIMKNFARSIPKELKQRDRFRTSHGEVFAWSEDQRTDWSSQESSHRRRSQEVKKILDRLDDREQKIIIHRFGLDYSREPQTLKEVGSEMGVTKERIRQIEARALTKLRAAVEADDTVLLDLF